MVRDVEEEKSTVVERLRSCQELRAEPHETEEDSAADGRVEAAAVACSREFLTEWRRKERCGRTNITRSG
jgi:hypothetical protein